MHSTFPMYPTQQMVSPHGKRHGIPRMHRISFQTAFRILLPGTYTGASFLLSGTLMASYFSHHLLLLELPLS